MSKKREQLVDTALDLFYRKGINTIGINEVLKESGVAKRTLYSHFASKDELVLAALEKRHHKFCSWLEKQLNQTNSDREVITSLFHSLRSWFAGEVDELGAFRGCFFINTSAEFADKDSKIFQLCVRHKNKLKQLIATHLSEENKDLVDAIYVMQEGVITTAHITEHTAEKRNDIASTCVQYLTAQLN